MPKISDIIRALEKIAPLSYQESYDNSGLLTGRNSSEVTGILISLDCVETVIDEAISKGCNLVIAHHPIIFGGLKKLTGANYVERTIIKAIKNDIAIYAIHTNLDNVHSGVNAMICEKLGLTNTRILNPKSGALSKLEFFVPKTSTKKVLEAIHAAGAGKIGNYDNCSFTVNGIGSFTPNELANPTIGQQDQQEHVAEDKVELIFPSHLESEIIAALQHAHPYDEVAYYSIKLANKNQEVGAGMMGELTNALEPTAFLTYLKKSMSLHAIRYTELPNRKIKKVAVCGGAGSFLLKTARAKGADAFVSGDFKYHEFFDAEEKIMIADIGHYESEVFTKELLNRILTEKFTNIATYLSEVNTNPVKYF